MSTQPGVAGTDVTSSPSSSRARTLMHAHTVLSCAGMALDLRPFMQRTPFVLQGNASLARAYRLFRTMGLHHLYVGPPKPQVIGLLTRKVHP